MGDRASAAVSKTASAGPDPLIGRLINDRFKIVALIARGGMGKVYRAEQAPLGRMCAIKVLNPSYAGEHDPEFHKRFFLEASIASKLTHPNTVTIFDYGRTDDDVYYMAMEYLEGRTLHRAIREAGFFPEERAAHVARQVCRALREAHSLGVIHRDLKPANVFLVEHGDENDFVKVLDFGLVKNVSENKGEDLTQTGLFMGSPKYMAPEQIRGDRVDARTDIYALGIIMYEMLAGKVPFDRPNSVNILMAHVNEEPPPIRTMNPNAQLSTAFEEVVMRCMAKEPDVRYRSMDEVLAAVKKVGGGALTATVSGVGTTGEFRTLSSSGGRSVTSSQSTPAVTASGSHPAVAPATSSEPGVVASPLASIPSTTDAVQLVSQPPRGSSKGVVFGAVAAGVVVLGIAGFYGLRGSGTKANASVSVPEPTATNALTAAPAPQPSAPVTASAPPAAGSERVILNSDPDGASVKEDGVEICTSTPCAITYRGADADPAKEHKLVFSKGGFKSEAKTIKLADSPVTVKLAKEAPRWNPGAGNAGTKEPGPAPPPAGYKGDIPY